MISEFFGNSVKALNDVRSNVWSILLIIAGISLIMHGHENAGSSLVTGAFAVFRASSPETAPVPPNARPREAQEQAQLKG